MKLLAIIIDLRLSRLAFNVKLWQSHISRVEYWELSTVSANIAVFILLFRSRLCHYSVGGAWWHLGFCESF
jgi:hypothetical protein